KPAPHPAAVGQKFTPEGAPISCPGSTTLCHIDRASPAHASLVRAQQTLRDGPHAGAFTFLPPASFHMTVFDGVISTHRAAPAWPAHLATDLPMDSVTDDLLPRVQALALPQQFAIRPVQLFAGFSLQVAGNGREDEDALRDARDSLSDAMAFRRPDHDAYTFHITFGYLLRWLTPDEANAVIALSDAVFATLTAEVKDLTIGPIEFCAFETMHHFEPLAVLT
ncbi:MAG: DUF1868 domain-containing protein, partial [Pseudomonadota bacterium]